MLTLILCFLVAGAAAAVFLVTRVMRAFMEFVSPPAEGEPSPLARFIDSAAQVLASQLTMNLKTSVLGKVSGLTRALDGAEADVTQDLLAARSPLLAGLLALSPKLGRRLAKSPALAAALSSLDLSKLMNAGKGPPSNGSVPPAETGFGL